MKQLLTTRNLKLDTQKCLLKCYVWSTFLYACETWTLNAAIWEKINAFEMWMYRKLLKIPYTDHVSNKEVLHRVNEKEGELQRKIMRKKTEYFGHIIRANGLQRALLDGRTDKKRSRGRPRRMWTTDIREWTGLTYYQRIRKASDRCCWRSMTTSLLEVDATTR